MSFQFSVFCLSMFLPWLATLGCLPFAPLFPFVCTCFAQGFSLSCSFWASFLPLQEQGSQTTSQIPWALPSLPLWLHWPLLGASWQWGTWEPGACRLLGAEKLHEVGLQGRCPPPVLRGLSNTVFGQYDLGLKARRTLKTIELQFVNCFFSEAGVRCTELLSVYSRIHQICRDIVDQGSRVPHCQKKESQIWKMGKIEWTL